MADLDIGGARRIADTLGDGHGAFQVDVTEERSVERLFADVESELGSVAVLACVAGGPFLTPGRRPSIVDTTTENWCQTEALNSRGPLLCIRAMLRRRREKPSPTAALSPCRRVWHHAREPDRSCLFRGQGGSHPSHARNGP